MKRVTLIVLVVMALCGCGGEDSTSTHSGHGAKPKPAPFDAMSIELTDANLIEGREVWLKTCTGCHKSGLGGAPLIADKAEWAPRIAKGRETLHDHAINGFSGPLMLQMPPKGGYDYLTDEQVKAAVDFMVHASR